MQHYYTHSRRRNHPRGCDPLITWAIVSLKYPGENIPVHVQLTRTAVMKAPLLGGERKPRQAKMRAMKVMKRI